MRINLESGNRFNALLMLLGALSITRSAYHSLCVDLQIIHFMVIIVSCLFLQDELLATSTPTKQSQQSVQSSPSGFTPKTKVRAVSPKIPDVQVRMCMQIKCVV